MNRAMFTDLYAFTMAAAYVRAGMSERRVTCEMFTRRLPRNRRFMVAAGLQETLDALREWQLSDDDIRYLKDVPMLRGVMTPEVEERLRRLRFTGDVWMMPEGTVFFPHEPVMRVTAPVLEAQIVETYLLSVFNQAASVASKGARVMLGARGKPVVEFGMRRVHPDAALSSTRAAYLVGLSGTSNVVAGKTYGIPVTGTMAHAFVMVHESEEAAFRDFVAAYPSGATLLVDTYDTLQGVRRAIRVAGPELGAVRLDSGDLLEMSRKVRVILDEAGRESTRIIVSGDLDEHKVEALVAANAPIDVYAVGTELAASADAPTLGAVYKVVHDHEQDRSLAKFSKDKATHAGVHQVFRRKDAQGRMAADVLGLDGETLPGHEALLQQVMKDGRPHGTQATLSEARAHCAAQLQALPEYLKDLSNRTTDVYPVTASDAATAATETARRRFVSA
ncbi:MAG: nicotinate phosphoribosyltransferase [Myxococcota bacterium]